MKKRTLFPQKKKKTTVEVAAAVRICGCFSTTRTKLAEEKLVSVEKISERAAVGPHACLYSCFQARANDSDKDFQTKQCSNDRHRSRRSFLTVRGE